MGDEGTIRTKDPEAVRWLPWDWSDYLAATGDTIATSEFIVPAGLTNLDERQNATATAVKVSGGTLGADYEVTNRITTTGGETDDRTMRVLVRKR